MGKCSNLLLHTSEESKNNPRGLHNQCDQNFFCGLKRHDPYDLHTKQVTPARQQREISAESPDSSLPIHPPDTHTLECLRKS